MSIPARSHYIGREAKTMAIAFIWFREEQEAPFGKPASRAYIMLIITGAQSRARKSASRFRDSGPAR
jgi:hypothetical protein